MAETSGIRPQPGPQEAFLSTKADIAIYGGAAGGGKSFGLLLEPLRHINNPKFGAVIFRRQGVEIRKEGGLWDESESLYHHAGGTPRQQMLDWKFPKGARVSMSHLEHEKDKYTWQGAQIALLEFDELTHFSRSQFFYMLSRNRSTCGVRPYVRASTNPDADSWVAEFIAWWINPETGYPILERSGVLRWFIRRGDDLIWGDSKEEMLEKHPDAIDAEVKSVTFIASSIHDNKILLAKDPGYLGNLKALSLVDNERLEKGNWKIRPSAGLYFKRSYFPIVDAAPAASRRVRCWDLAGTDAEEGGTPDWTVGMKMSRDQHGTFYIEHIERFQASPEKVESSIVNTAAGDGKAVRVRIPQDPGQAGKMQARYYVNKLAGFNVTTKRVTGDKVVRATPASAQAGAGNIKVVRGPWNEAFFTEVENFPGKGKDDQIDALSDCIDELIDPSANPSIRSL